MGLVCSISNFFINKTYQASNWSTKKIPSWGNLALAVAKFIGKMQKKSGIMKSGLDAMPLFLLDDMLRCSLEMKLFWISVLGMKSNTKECYIIYRYFRFHWTLSFQLDLHQIFCFNSIRQKNIYKPSSIWIHDGPWMTKSFQ